jgi:hypothetical protein
MGMAEGPTGAPPSGWKSAGRQRHRCENLCVTRGVGFGGEGSLPAVCTCRTVWLLPAIEAADLANHTVV